MDAVLFDLDGTLVDHLGAQATAFRLGMTRLGVSAASPDQPGVSPQLALWRRLERTHMDAYLAGACSFAEQRRRRLALFLAEAGETPLDTRANDDWWARYSADYAASWTAYEDVAGCFEALLAIEPRPRLGVLTNGDGAQQRAKLARFGLLEQLDVVAVSSEIGAAKPAPESFLEACRQLGVDPAETLMVGDLLELDAEGAEAAGLIGVWLDREATVVAASCPRITTLAMLPALLLSRRASAPIHRSRRDPAGLPIAEPDVKPEPERRPNGRRSRP
jgi:putative hydrolase of the HAD superfamily